MGGSRGAVLQPSCRMGCSWRGYHAALLCSLPITPSVATGPAWDAAGRKPLHALPPRWAVLGVTLASPA